MRESLFENSNVRIKNNCFCGLNLQNNLLIIKINFQSLVSLFYFKRNDDRDRFKACVFEYIYRNYSVIAVVVVLKLKNFKLLSQVTHSRSPTFIVLSLTFLEPNLSLTSAAYVGMKETQQQHTYIHIFFDPNSRTVSLSFPVNQKAIEMRFNMEKIDKLLKTMRTLINTQRYSCLTQDENFKVINQHLICLKGQFVR
jgi:hypothetical protein